MTFHFTPRACKRIKTVRDWWRINRPAAPRLFLDELRAAIAQIRATPQIGAPHRRTQGRLMRRVLLP